MGVVMKIYLSNKYAASGIDRIIPIYHSDGSVTLDINAIREPVIELEPYECLDLLPDGKQHQIKFIVKLTS